MPSLLGPRKGPSVYLHTLKPADASKLSQPYFNLQISKNPQQNSLKPFSTPKLSPISQQTLNNSRNGGRGV
ncbi:MAG: hypothetical protein [Microvirus sp.]|nr:MAG: hypothetical protein [Microvirus sp.]